MEYADDLELEDEFDDYENIRIENAPKHVIGSSLFMWSFYDDADCSETDTEIVRVLDENDYKESATKFWNKCTIRSDDDDTDSLASSDEDDEPVELTPEERMKLYIEKFNGYVIFCQIFKKILTLIIN